MGEEENNDLDSLDELKSVIKNIISVVEGTMNRIPEVPGLRTTPEMERYKTKRKLWLKELRKEIKEIEIKQGIIEPSEKEYTFLCVDGVAKEISGKGSSNFEFSTIQTVLKEFILNPKVSRRELIEKLSIQIKAVEHDKLSEQRISDWEKKLIQRIELQYPDQAQKLRR